MSNSNDRRAEAKRRKNLIRKFSRKYGSTAEAKAMADKVIASERLEKRLQQDSGNRRKKRQPEDTKRSQMRARHVQGEAAARPMHRHKGQ